MKLITTFLVAAQGLALALGQECVCTDHVTIVQTVTQTVYSGDRTGADHGPAPVTITNTRTVLLPASTVTETMPPITMTETITPITITETYSASVITETLTLTSVYTPVPQWTKPHSNATYHWKSSSALSSSSTNMPTTSSPSWINATISSSMSSITPSPCPTNSISIALNSTSGSIYMNSTATSSVPATINSTTTSPTSASAPPTVCYDSCAFSIEANPTLCASLFLTSIVPSAVTQTVYTTAYPQNVTLYPIVSTETDIQTLLYTDIEILTTSTTFSDDFVATSTVIDSVVSIFSTTGTDIVTAATAIPRRDLGSNVSSSACSDTAQLSSACSCAGYTQVTTVLPVPIVTITSVSNATVTFTNDLTTTTQTTTSATITAISDVGYLSISDITSIVDVTATTIIDVAATSTFTPTPSPTPGTAYCENGDTVNGLSAACLIGPCTSFNLRIEGATDTIYEGPIYTGPEYITTKSGGTHLCNGLNDGANPSAGGTGTTALASAGELCGFSFDGTFDTTFDDFFIETIGDTSQTSNEYWGILLDYAFTPGGGCETEPGTGSDLLWAFNAFNVNYFLEVEPATVSLAVGESQVFTVTGHDGDGDAAVPIAGATFNGLTTDAKGQVTYVAGYPGTFRIKATRSDSIRSNAVMITNTI